MSQNRQDSAHPAGENSLQVTDPEDFNTQRRLRQLHNAREQFPRIRREAREKYNPANERRSELTEEAYFEKVANALLDYLSEVEPVVISLEEDDERRELWTDDPVDDRDDADDLTLEDILEQAGKRENEDEEMVPISEATSRKAYRKANKFLAEVGLGLNLDTGGLPMIRNYDASRDDDEMTVDSAEMNGDPPL